MTTEPLDFARLLAAVRDDDPRGEEWERMPAATRIGHVHLVMSDLDRAEAFYRGLLGFGVTVRYGGAALFVSAGGYHHHIGLNIFAGSGLPPAPPGSAGLRHFAVQLPDRGELERLAERVRAAGIAVEQTPAGALIRDPAQNAVLLTARDPAPARPARERAATSQAPKESEP